MQALPVFLLSLGLLFVVPGCSAKRWVPWSSSSETHEQATSRAAPTPVDISPAPQPEVSPPSSDSSTALKWDFSQRSGQENTPDQPSPPVTPSMVAPVATAEQEITPEQPPVVPPAAPAVVAPVAATEPPPPISGSSGGHSWIPGLAKTAKRSEDESNPQYVTEEDLLKVVGEFQRVAAKDTYRFPMPKDVTGANVNKATLRRLQDYEVKHPGAYPEILAFTRGRAYESMHEYDKAIAQYQIVSQSKNRLNADAGKAVEILTQFRDLKQRPITAKTLGEYIETLDRYIAAWQALQEQQVGTPYAALAREEEERLDQAKVTFLLINRYRLEDGNASVAVAYDQLVKKHKESKNIYRYQIEFGDFYFTLAQEYVAQNDPQTLQFDSATFETVGRAALRLYAQVAQEDGVIEKLEAKGKLEALEAYMAKIGKLSR